MFFIKNSNFLTTVALGIPVISAIENAFSIAEITGIPRATVVRKLEFLMKNKFLNISEKKLYTFGMTMQSKQFKVISKLQDRNMNALSKFLYRVFNQINVINSN